MNCSYTELDGKPAIAAPEHVNLGLAIDVPGKDGKAVHVTGKYVVVWKRTGGAWQLYRDIWNDTPPR